MQLQPSVGHDPHRTGSYLPWARFAPKSGSIPADAVESVAQQLARVRLGQSVIGPLPTRGCGRPPSATATHITISSGRGASATITVMVSK